MSEKQKRLWNVEVTFSYAVLADDEREAVDAADVAKQDIDMPGAAVATLAAARMYTLPDGDWDEKILVYGNHKGDITWADAVKADRAIDPEAAAKADAFMDRLRAAQKSAASAKPPV